MLECAECLCGIVGRRAVIDDPLVGKREGLVVRSIKYSLGKNGESTTVVLGKEKRAMWLMNYITKNSITAPKAEKGGVKSSGNTVSVDSSEEHREIKCCVPYGFASVVPVGESAVVLPLANGEVSLGVLAKNVELDEGEVMLSSKGGASIVLKNDGRVLINGKAV